MYDVATGRAKVAGGTSDDCFLFYCVLNLVHEKLIPPYSPDFGVSRATKDNIALEDPKSLRVDDSLLTTEVGTPQFMAPELCAALVQVWEKGKDISQDARGRVDALKSYVAFRESREHIAYNGQQIDIYAFACTMSEFVSHSPPFRELKGASEVIEKVHQGQRPNVPSQDEVCAPVGWRELMSEAWAQDPHRRPAFTVIAERIARFEDPIESRRETNLARRPKRVWKDGVESFETSMPMQRLSLQEPLLGDSHAYHTL